MTETKHQIAVLTGDLVNSTELPPESIDRAMAALADASERLGALQERSLRFTRHRGDGWQVVLSEPGLYLRAALGFRAAVKTLGQNFDTYIGIADGQVDGELPSNLNSATQDVFVNSGLALETLKASRRLGWRFLHDDFKDKAATLTLADQISQGWTAAQSAAVKQVIFNYESRTMTDVAEALGISRQAATKSLDAAGYNFLQQALYFAEKVDP
ncbi:hypothetical protein [Marivivens marinus]|uniref:hypothetical protein n=1 Tax=Marivivens marinus TaxID=3110173 RepID=UPI003B84B1E8